MAESGTLAALMKKSNEEIERDFYLAFGQFICHFASTEGVVHMLFSRISGLKGDRARSIVGGEQVGRMMELTKRIAKATPRKRFSEANLKELETIFDQLGKIATFRNNLVHGGAEFDEGVIRSANYSRAKSHAAIEEITFDTSHLQSASYDLMSIRIRLHHLRKAEKWTRQLVPTLRRQPWRYKSPPVESWSSRLLRDVLSRAHLPRSSGA